MELVLVIIVVLAALAFDYINGFHDAANSIATVVSTRVLSPGQAVMLAAVMNLIGAFAGTAVAKTISSGLVDSDVVNMTSQVVICALLGGIIWNLFTWWRGMPSSSSHALIGGLCGAALAAADNNWAALIWSRAGESFSKNAGIFWKVVVPMVSSPVASTFRRAPSPVFSDRSRSSARSSASTASAGGSAHRSKPSREQFLPSGDSPRLRGRF